MTDEQLSEHLGISQHASYFPLGSTVGALVDVHCCITTFSSNHNTVDLRLTCLHFTKAFDKLQHLRLGNHLNTANFIRGFLNKLTTLSTYSSQGARLNGRAGDMVFVPSVLPQKLLLGLYVLGMFISTLKIVARSTSLVNYTDDLKDPNLD